MRLEDLELEPEFLWLVLFGPGVGESIVLAVPTEDEQAWVAIDSLRRQDQRGDDTNPATVLLDNHGGLLGAAALTHPHRDHVRGFVQLVDRLEEGAPLGCLGIYIDGRWRRLDDAAEALNRGAAAAAFNRIEDTWNQFPASRWDLLAPGSRQIGSATLEVLHPMELPSRRPVDLNTLSTPMLLSYGETRLLLGADLPISGWKKVKRNFPGASDLASSHALKVSHHGSGGAQHRVAIGSPPPRSRLAALTPYTCGKYLPDYSNSGGVARLLDSHEAVEVTSMPPEARGKRVSRESLIPKRRNFGELQLSVEAPPASPLEAWIAVAFDEAGNVVEERRGDASGTAI